MDVRSGLSDSPTFAPLAAADIRQVLAVVTPRPAFEAGTSGDRFEGTIGADPIERELFQSTKRVQYGPWFADGEDDPRGRSCREMRACVTEFGCQGLELNASLLAWGSDMIREGGVWTNRLARGYQRPSFVRNPFQLRMNAYRVLLTRGRDATVVFVPPMHLLDETYAFLLESGFRELDFVIR